MEIKASECRGKTLRYVHQSGGRVRFNKTDFFNILGVNSDNYIESGESNYIDYEVALPLAIRIDGEFERWLTENFQDYEIGAFSEGK
jgi:hypothetical protein